MHFEDKPDLQDTGVNRISVVSGGINYVDGDVIAFPQSQTNASVFRGAFITSNTTIASVRVLSPGSGFLRVPSEFVLVYSGTQIQQNGSISHIRVVNPGQYYAPGDVLVADPSHKASLNRHPLNAN